MHIQKIGRVMRIADGKDFGLVIDHSGNWLGFYDATHAFFDDRACSELSSEKLQKADPANTRVYSPPEMLVRLHLPATREGY